MTDIAAIQEAHARVIARFADLLRPASGTGRIPHLEWNVGELGAHVLMGLRAYAQAAVDGIEVWTDLSAGPEENARLLRETEERDPAQIAEELPRATERLHAAWSRTDGLVTWSGGLRLPLKVVVGLQLGDVLVHGWDLSKATGEAWSIDRADAVLAIQAALAVAPHFMAPAAEGFTGAFEIRLRKDGRFLLRFTAGKLSVTSGGERSADCRLSADPRAFLLAAYGRVPVWRTAATAGIVAWGRKPWLAIRFNSLLLSP